MIVPILAGLRGTQITGSISYTHFRRREERERGVLGKIKD
jgi:hypothetical protein